ncbi:MAG: tetratricopeptide repeat protein, partial [Myxococcales bacterium]|nr:tetratricopeptide repeat protein [Myxococcales bacterium]
LQVCFLFEEILEDVPLAIRAYQEVVELDPDHVASRRALDRLYRRAGRFRDLVALLRQEIDRGLEADDEVARLLEIGEIHERELQEPSVAVDHYEQVLEREPSHTGAQRALERLIEVPAQRQRIASILEPIYDGQGVFSDLVRILRVQLEDVTEVGPRMGLLLRVASLEEEKLRSPEGAFSALSDAVVTDPSDASVREELARVATMRGADAERAEVLERAIGRAESSHLQAELLFEVAKVWDDRVGDPTRAESAYQRLIQAEPDNPDTVLPAARALERLHLGREAHAELAEDFRIQIRLELDAEKRRDLLARLATLLEDTLGDSAAAIHAHRRRLEEDPADLDALRSLERLYENGEDWQRLIGTLQSRDQVTLEEGEQRAIAARIAEVYETKLDDAENAIVAYNDALSRFGPDDATLAALARLYEKTERFDDLLEILEMKLERAEDESSRAGLRFRMGEILRTKTRDVERAVDAYAQVLEHEPGHEGVVNALEEIVTDPDAPHRVEAARVLVPQLEGAQRWGDLIAVLEVAAETDDPTEKLRA